MRRLCGTNCESESCSGFVICSSNDDTWELVCGEDAMQCRVGELIEQTGFDPDEIYVFRVEDEIDNEAQK